MYLQDCPLPMFYNTWKFRSSITRDANKSQATTSCLTAISVTSAWETERMPEMRVASFSLLFSSVFVKSRSHLADYFPTVYDRYNPFTILNYLRISRRLFSFCHTNPMLPWIVRIMSVKCSEMIIMNLHIIENTFVTSRINSHTLHFHHFDWFQIVRDCWI